MKHTLCLIGISILLASCAPARKAVVKMDYPDPFQFETVDTASATKAELYVRAHEWIAKTYGSAKSVIDMQDKEAGKIIGKARFDAPVTDYGYTKMHAGDYISYTFSIDVKDGKYRFLIDNFSHEPPLFNGSGNRGYVKTYGSLDKDYVPVVNPTTGQKSSGRRYYEVKNEATVYANALLVEFGKAMHTPGKDF